MFGTQRFPEFKCLVLGDSLYLINISGSVVKDSEHWNESVRGSVRSGDVRAGGPDAVNIEADTSGRL